MTPTPLLSFPLTLNPIWCNMDYNFNKLFPAAIANRPEFAAWKQAVGATDRFVLDTGTECYVYGVPADIMALKAAEMEVPFDLTKGLSDLEAARATLVATQLYTVDYVEAFDFDAFIYNHRRESVRACSAYSLSTSARPSLDPEPEVRRVYE